MTRNASLAFGRLAAPDGPRFRDLEGNGSMEPHENPGRSVCVRAAVLCCVNRPAGRSLT